MRGCSCSTCSISLACILYLYLRHDPIEWCSFSLHQTAGTSRLDAPLDNLSVTILVHSSMPLVDDSWAPPFLPPSPLTLVSERVDTTASCYHPWGPLGGVCSHSRWACHSRAASGALVACAAARDIGPVWIRFFTDSSGQKLLLGSKRSASTVASWRSASPIIWVSTATQKRSRARGWDKPHDSRSALPHTHWSPLFLLNCRWTIAWHLSWVLVKLFGRLILSACWYSCRNCKSCTLCRTYCEVACSLLFKNQWQVSY